MLMLDLTTQAEAFAIAAADVQLTELNDDERAAAVATWRGRMVNEHISARVFAGLIPQLMAAGIDAERQAAVADMIVDEFRHARQCAAVVVALGSQPVAPMPALPAVADHGEVPPLEAVVRNVMSISCLSETVAVALISAERDAAGPPWMRTVLAQILADEVRHARFGWQLLESVAPGMSADCKLRLGRYLITAFAELREHELAHLPARPSPSGAAEAVGVCDGHSARELFLTTVRQVIVPGLEQHGIPAAAAWQASLV